jgi:DNA-directed RNA polymerase III subunit RPC11
MLFCPRCSNLLLLGVDGQEMRFCCQTCPYVHTITQKMYKTVAFDKKNVAEVESEKNWTNEDSGGTNWNDFTLSQQKKSSSLALVYVYLY